MSILKNFICLFFIFNTVNVMAGVENAANMIGYWGGGAMDDCSNYDVPNDACLGTVATNCNLVPQITNNEFPSSGLRSFVWARGSDKKRAAIHMLVATSIKEGGAKLCPIQIEAMNNGKTSWTEYAQHGTDVNCVWLCRDGFTGPQCDQKLSDTVTSCDTTELKREKYNNLSRITAGANIEDQIVMFVANKGYDCGYKKQKWQEHDMILAVVGWLDSGHGAKVRQMTVHAKRSGWGKKMVSWPSLYPASGAPEILVCKNGYRQNSDGTDCIEINENLCAAEKTCEGWTSGFDEKIHAYKSVEVNGTTCYEYRCTEKNQAFKPDTHTCADCGTNARFGSHPKTGVCHECEIGQVFDANATDDDNLCKDASALSKTDLQYGKGKTKSTAGDLDTQCWAKDSVEEYKSCVTGT